MRRTLFPTEALRSRKARCTHERLILALPLLLLSCLSGGGQGQRDMRTAVLTLLEDQIIDNLIRLRRGLPILHVDYTTLTGTVKLTTNASAEAAIVPGTDTFDLGVSVELEDTMQIVARPVLDDDKVYREYLKFAFVPGNFQEGTSPPTGKTLILREVGTRFYWIPDTSEARAAFRQLTLATTVLRGTLEAPPEDYSVRVTNAVPLPDETIAGNLYRVLNITVAPAVPNDNGLLSVPVEGHGTITLRVEQNVTEVEGETPNFGDEVRRLRVRIATSETGAPSGAIATALMAAETLSLSLDRIPPKIRSNTELLKNIAESLDLIRLDALRDR